MPIVVKDFTWTQTEKTVHIRVPISKATHEAVDLFTTDSYIKAHYSPFLFEVFLLHDVEIKNSKCIVKEDLIVLDLKKKDDIEWEHLEKDLTKPEKMILKQEILEKCQEEAKQMKEDRVIKKSQLDRYAVQQAMEIDSRQHEIMDGRRNDERKKAMDQLEAWRVGVGNSSVTVAELPPEEVSVLPANTPKIVEITDTEENVKPVVEKHAVNKTKPALKSKTSEKIPVRSEYVEKKKQEDQKRVLPKMRQAGTLEVTHTPRTFPTPSRESTAHEEEVWLRNITMARRATGFVSEDLRPEEQDPQWCKEKGDLFFRNGNFLGAISAYTHGIKLSDKLPSLFSNRAAVHFALGNFNKCANDCTTALELMKPACEGNRKSRAKCIVRRAAALARAGLLSKAIDEMKAAIKLLPEDESIKRDLYDMERAWEQNPDSD